MVDVLDFRQEARGCLRLAESETQAEVKTILMGMALGWLTLANQGKPPDDAANDVRAPLDDEFVGKLADELAPKLADEPIDEVA
jgi:hypothetical protein